MRFTLFALAFLLYLPLSTRAQVSIGGDTTVCSGNYPYFLYTNTFGGVWSSSSGAVTPDGVFTPRRGLGTFVATYTLSGVDFNKRITVLNGPVVNAGKDTVVCDRIRTPTAIGSAGVAGLRYKWNRRGGFAEGLSSDTISRPDVTLLNNTTLPFIYVYTLAVTDPVQGCTSYDSVRVYVFPNTTAVVRLGRDTTVCSSAGAFQLRGATPPSGFWYGVGVTFPDVYTPSPSIVGTHEITYRLPCSPSLNPPPKRLITVIEPDLRIGIDTQVCANARPFIRRSNIPGGVWRGVSISASGLFTPNQDSLGMRRLTYTINEGTPCEYSKFIFFNVVGIPAVDAGEPVTRCSNDKPFQLTGESPPNDGNGLWDSQAPGGIFSPSLLRTGVFSVSYSYRDQNGCSNSDIKVVTINVAPIVEAGLSFSICGNTPPFNLQGYTPARGVWSGVGVDSVTGRYTPRDSIVGFNLIKYTVTNAVGCVSADSLTVQVLPFPKNVDAGRDTAVCANNPAFNLNRGTPAGGKYFGNGVDSNSGRFTPRPTLVGQQQIYYRVRTDRGCQGRDSLRINVRPLPPVDAGTDFAVCSGAEGISVGMPRLPNSPGTRYAYAWSGPEGTNGFDTISKSNPVVRFSNPSNALITRTYFFKVARIDAFFPTCFNQDTLQVKIYPKPRARTIPPRNFRGCEGDTILLRAEIQPRLYYQWFSGTSILNPTPSPENTTYAATETGTYYLIVVDTIRVRGGVCADTSQGDSVFIKQRNRPIISGYPDFCAGRTDTLTVSPANTRELVYQWLRDRRPILGARNTTYNADKLGNYQVIIADGRFGVACYDTSSIVVVDSIPKPYNDLVITGSDTTYPVCSKQIPFRVAGPAADSAYPTSFKYLWNDGNTTRFNNIDTVGQYILTVYNRCSASSDTLNISEIIPTPVFTVLKSGAPDTTLCQNLPIIIRGPDGMAFYQWSPVDSNSSFINYDTKDTTNGFKSLYLTVISPQGCSYSDSALIKVETCQPKVYLASAYTPQGDNINDKWRIQVYSCSKLKLWVYNRWGEQVYYAGTLEDALNLPWDGTYKGSQVISGAYQYVLEYTGVEVPKQPTLTYRRSGNVTVIR